MDYKEKLRLAKEALESGSYDKDTIEYIFPELKESEDEKIRKELISALKFANVKGVYGKHIAWLEKQDKQGEQKPSTIDVDEMVDDYANNKERGNEIFGQPVPCMIRAYKQGIIDAIKKVVLKPTWSEEDEKHVDSLLKRLEGLCRNEFERTRFAINEDADWLKSLKQRTGWKPTEEQMRALHDMNLTGNISYARQGQTLIELYNDLNKLK